MKAPDLSTLNSWYESAYDNSRRQRWEWFVIDQFLRGNHDIKGNPEDNSLTVQRSGKSSVNFPINKIHSTFRSVRAFVTRHKPTVQVEAENSTDSSKKYARQANKVLARDNQLNNYRKISKEWVYFGVKYGVGYRQVGYDPQKKVAIRWTVDPFDILLGNKYGEMEDAPYVIKTFVRTIGYMHNKYPKHKADIVPDNIVSEDEYKRLAWQIQTGSDQLTTKPNSQEEQTVTGREIWYRVFKPNKAGGFINKIIATRTSVIDYQETPYTEYPFIPYKADITPNEHAGDGHLKHIIAPQRLFNMLNTQILEYNHIVNRGRYIIDQNSGFQLINAEEGQIIKKKPGKSVVPSDPPRLNPIIYQQLLFANEMIEDIGGQHDASQGATPERVTSGKAIEQLQLGDSNNISDLRDNFEDSLALEAQWILKMYSLFEHEGIVLTNQLKDKEEEEFAVLGSTAAKKAGKQTDKYFMEANGEYCDVCAILPDNEVKVAVTSSLGETKEARINLIMQLVELGLPLKYLLEHLEFTNVSDILERISSEALAELAIENAKSQAGVPPQAEGQPPIPNGQPPIPPAPTQQGEVQ